MAIKRGGNALLLYTLLAFSSLLLLIPALYNHYPLLNPDAGTYLASGFKPETPMDRPITYGLLIRLMSINGLSLWGVVAGQAWLMAWLIFRIVLRVAGRENYEARAALIVAFLALFTGLSWLVSQAQPDVYTTIALLCAILLLMGQEQRPVRIMLYLLFLVSVAVHMSHPALFLMLLVTCYIIKCTWAQRSEWRDITIATGILIALTLCTMLVMGPALSKSKHVFMMGSLLEKGVLQTYLQENCAANNYKICAYKDVLPAKLDDFIWDPSSPLYKVGDWKGSKPEFTHIIGQILTTPRYLWLFIKAAARQAAQQAIYFDIGDGNSVFVPGSNVSTQISNYLPGDAGAFSGCRQNNGTLLPAFILPNKVFPFVIAGALILVMLQLARWRLLPSPLRLLLVACIAGVVFNCIDCGAFSELTNRYGCKMIWLLPFCALVSISRKRVVA